MNKNDLIASVASSAGLSKSDATRSIESLLDAVTNALKRDEKVSIVGFGKACEIAQSEMAAEAKHLTHLRNQLRQRISENIDFTHVHGHPEKRLPGNLNISFEFVESLSLLENLSNIALSTGSACSSSSIEASRVLVAMGVEEELARAPIRFGLGRGNTLDQVNFVAAQLAEQVTKLRDLSSMYKMVRKGGYQTV